MPSFCRNDRVVRKGSHQQGTVNHLSADPPQVHVTWDGDAQPEVMDPDQLEEARAQYDLVMPTNGTEELVLMVVNETLQIGVRSIAPPVIGPATYLTRDEAREIGKRLIIFADTRHL
jgi:hypothetical protein